MRTPVVISSLFLALVGGTGTDTRAWAQVPAVTLPESALPNDGLAEVARYQYTRHGRDAVGTASLIIVKETLNPKSYVKTNRSGGLPAVKIMFMKSLPGRNWTYRDNFALYSRMDHAPLKLAITSEEWCGNNFMEWRTDGDRVHRIGRPYTDDRDILTDTIEIPSGYIMHAQLPLLARAVAMGPSEKTLTMVAPQTAYLPPHRELLVVDLRRTGKEWIQVPAGRYEAVVVEVSARESSKRFSKPERYWLAGPNFVMVKAERNEGGPRPERAHYELLDARRFPYWSKKLPSLPTTTAQK